MYIYIYQFFNVKNKKISHVFVSVLTNVFLTLPTTMQTLKTLQFYIVFSNFYDIYIIYVATIQRWCPLVGGAGRFVIQGKPERHVG